MTEGETASAEIVATPHYELHEWGVVDVPAGSGPVEISAGAGQPERPMSVRKPVVYVHLLDGVEEVSFSMRVTLGGGSFVEHDPAGTITGTTLEWPSITAHAAHCSPTVAATGGSTARRMPRLSCATPDGICEITELPRYDAPSAACLDVLGGGQTSLVFYRGEMPSASIPMTVTRAADLTVTATPTATFMGTPGGLLRLSTRMSGPWPAGRVVIARAEVPGFGGSVTLPVGTEAITRAEGVAELTRAIVALGLTEDEAAAFMNGWADELFGADTATRDLSAREGMARDAAAPAQPRLEDVLLFFLPYPTIDAISTIDATPQPASIRRAILVRIDLGAVTTA